MRNRKCGVGVGAAAAYFLLGLSGCAVTGSLGASVPLAERRPSSLQPQREACELASSQLTLLMHGNTGTIDPKQSLPAEVRGLSANEVVSFVEANQARLRFRRLPWLDNFLASPAQRRYALAYTLVFNDNFAARYEYSRSRVKGSDAELAASAQRIQALYSAAQSEMAAGRVPKRLAIEKIRAEMAAAKKANPTFDRSFFKGKAPAAVRTLGADKACRDLKLADPKACQKAALYSHDSIMNPMDINTVPFSGDTLPLADVSNLETTLRVLEAGLADPYLAGLARYEERLAQHVADPAAVTTDVFTDLVRSFGEAGDGEAAARDKALDVLSVVSTNGSDFVLNEHLFSELSGQGDQRRFEAPNPKFLSMVRLSMALPYFDLVKRGNLYSSPAGYASECNTSKYYHFWMSAYLVRSLVKAGFSKEAAAAAVLVNHIGYRSLYDPFAADFSFDHPGHVILRTDLAGVGLGILFGAHLEAGGGTFSFQEAFDQLKPDPTYRPGALDTLAAATIPSASAYGKFMKTLGVVPYWGWIKEHLPK